MGRAGLGADDLHASGSVDASGLLSVQVLNTRRMAVEYRLRIGDRQAEVEIDANALQTIRVRLH